MAVQAQKSFIINSEFNGYQNRKDNTNLPPGVLIEGSQNVLIKTTGRVGIANGFTLDGQSGAAINAGILSSFDTDMNFGVERNLRAYTDPTTGHGVLQFRYKAADETVTWTTIPNASHDFASGLFRFTRFFDYTSEKNDVILMVNGTPYVYEWSGATATFASATANTITKEGTSTWGETGFYALGNKKIRIGAVEYTYTAGEGTTTLTGVTPDPTAGGHSAGDLIFQSLVVVANSAITVLPDTFKNSYISTLKNQVYYGSDVENEVYISKLNNYKDCSVATPRVVGEGGLLHLDANVKGFIAQENEMYITAGKNQWYKTSFKLSSDNAKEALDIERLKTASKQGAFSQELVTNDKNNVIFVSNEPVLTTLGRVSGVISTPQSQDISWPIVNDFNNYNFTGGACKYHKNFIYTSCPINGIIRVYNQTKADNQFWEAPITYPVAMFSVIDGELYGHSYSNAETYKLFDGGSFNGSPYTAVSKFSYQNYGDRTNSKGFNQFYNEGYISGNSLLTLGIVYEVDGNEVIQEYNLKGNDKKFVASYKSKASLGKEKLGSNPLGGQKTPMPKLPPKFRWIKTFTPNYFYEQASYYKSTGKDMNWEILAFGPRLILGKDLNVSIKD